jgi:hypothetical protein
VWQDPPKKGGPLKAAAILIGCIFVAGTVISALADQGDSGGVVTRDTTDGGGSPTALPAPMGTAVRDGKFEFTVKSMRCGATSVGTGGVTKKAQGKYCLIDVAVVNIGDQAQAMSASNQYLYDAAERRFDADSSASFYLEEDAGRTIYEDINPGNSINGTLVFDVPTSVTPAVIELHDSLFSGGTKVALRPS